MDPRLNISDDLRNELTSVLRDCEKLSKDRYPALRITAIQKKIDAVVNNTEFKERFNDLQPVIKKFQDSLRTLESMGKDRSFKTRESLSTTNEQIKKLFRFLLVAGPESVPESSSKERRELDKASEEVLFKAVSSNDHTGIKRMLSAFRLENAQIYHILEHGDLRTVLILSETSPKFRSLVRANDLEICSRFESSLEHRPETQNRQIYKLLASLGLNAPIGMVQDRGDSLPITPVLDAAMWKKGYSIESTNYFQQLIDFGYDIHPDSPSEDSPYLVEALEYANVDTVRTLLFNGVPVSPEMAKRLQADPAYQEIYRIREEALAKLERDTKSGMNTETRREQLLKLCCEIESIDHINDVGLTDRDRILRRNFEIMMTHNDSIGIRKIIDSFRMVSDPNELRVDFDLGIAEFALKSGDVELLSTFLKPFTAALREYHTFVFLFQSFRNRTSEQNRQVFRLLEETGLSLNQRRPSNLYPLQEVLYNRSLEEGVLVSIDLQELIDSGLRLHPDPDSEDSIYMLQCLNNFERTEEGVMREKLREMIGILLFNGADVSAETAKRLQSNPALQEIWSIREEALARQRKERGTQTGLGDLIGRDLIQLSADYADETRRISENPTLRDQFLQLCRDIQDERRLRSLKA